MENASQNKLQTWYVSICFVWDQLYSEAGFLSCGRMARTVPVFMSTASQIRQFWLLKTLSFSEKDEKCLPQNSSVNLSLGLIDLNCVTCSLLIQSICYGIHYVKKSEITLIGLNNDGPPLWSCGYWQQHKEVRWKNCWRDYHSVHYKQNAVTSLFCEEKFLLIKVCKDL